MYLAIETGVKDGDIHFIHTSGGKTAAVAKLITYFRTLYEPSKIAVAAYKQNENREIYAVKIRLPEMEGYPDRIVAFTIRRLFDAGDRHWHI